MPDKNRNMIFEAVLRIIQKYSPGFTVIYKNESMLHKIIGFILFFNPAYMTNYITTFSNKCAFPSLSMIQRDPEVAAQVLAHEGRHAIDERVNPILYKIKYLFPQILALLALLSIMSIWWRPALWFLLALILLGPLPAYWRTHYELRAYTITLAVAYYSTGSISYANIVLENIISRFTGPSYWYMWPFKGYIREELSRALTEITTGTLHQYDLYAAEIRELYLSRDPLAKG
jgi:hypothetical protein